MKNKGLLTLAAKVMAISVIITAPLLSCNSRGNSVLNIQTISFEKANDTLNMVVEYASSQNIDKLCSMGASMIMTKQQLADAGGWNSLPTQPPKVIGTYVIEPQKINGGTSLGGRVLVLEGTDGLGKKYSTDFLVTLNLSSKDVIVQYPIYWTGIKIEQPNTEGGGIATGQ